MPGFDFRDPLNLESQLHDEEKAVRKSAADFARNELAPHTDEWFATGSCDKAIMRELGALGFLGCTLAADLGGKGASYTAYGLIARELEAVDSGFRTMLSVQASLVIHPIATYGTDEQRERFLPALLSGEHVGCFGLTEDGSGSDPMSMATVARRARGGYRLSGSKTWISNAPVSDIFVIWAKSEAHDGAIRGFILQRGMPGLTTRAIDSKMSLRVCPTGTIDIDDVLVGEEALLPGVSGLKGPLGCLSMARFGIGWGVLGAARDCFEAAHEHGLSRLQFSRPLAGTQVYQLKLADMLTEITTGLQLALRIGRMLEAGKVASETISILKRDNCRKALRIARAARDMHGAKGVSLDQRVMRHMVNLESVNTYEGTADVHGLILGRAVTGIGAF